MIIKKNVFIAVGFFFLVFLGWRIFLLITESDQGSRRGMRGGQQVAVEVTSADNKMIRVNREFTGTVYPLYQYIVSPKVSGRVVQITKRIGDWVSAREVIARLDDAEYQQALLEAEANLKIAQASLAEAVSQMELAKQELDRVRSLQEKGIASPSELDVASTAYDAQKSRLELARAQVQQREAALQSAEIRLGYTVLSATEPGFVGERYVDEGSLLSPNSPLISIIGIDSVIVRATIIERDYGQISVGQSAEVEVDAFPGELFDGKVARIAPVLQESSRVAKMEVEVDNRTHRLKPGMFTTITVMLEEKIGRQVIPTGAIVRKDGMEGIFVIENDVDSDAHVARFKAIKTGIATDVETEILSPEIEGPVVTLGQHLLDDGSMVLLPEIDENSDAAEVRGRSSVTDEERKK
jgi:RND family efflux transporter MFP subunit